MVTKKVIRQHIADAYADCEKIYGCKISRIPLQISNRNGVKKLGSYHYNADGSPIKIMIRQNIDEKHIRETCYHEVAHYISHLFHKSCGHNDHWKDLMEKLGYEGATGKCGVTRKRMKKDVQQVKKRTNRNYSVLEQKALPSYVDKAIHLLEKKYGDIKIFLWSIFRRLGLKVSLVKKI
jgi:predicted SprT family Zn-dependent metalloprotease